jgi:hypothetical protein
VVGVVVCVPVIVVVPDVTAVVKEPLMINVNWVVSVFPPFVPVTVIVYMPIGVEDDVAMVNLLR